MWLKLKSIMLTFYWNSYKQVVPAYFMQKCRDILKNDIRNGLFAKYFTFKISQPSKIFRFPNFHCTLFSIPRVFDQFFGIENFHNYPKPVFPSQHIRLVILVQRAVFSNTWILEVRMLRVQGWSSFISQINTRGYK